MYDDASRVSYIESEVMRSTVLLLRNRDHLYKHFGTGHVGVYVPRSQKPVIVFDQNIETLVRQIKERYAVVTPYFAMSELGTEFPYDSDRLELFDLDLKVGGIAGLVRTFVVDRESEMSRISAQDTLLLAQVLGLGVTTVLEPKHTREVTLSDGSSGNYPVLRNNTKIEYYRTVSGRQYGPFQVKLELVSGENVSVLGRDFIKQYEGFDSREADLRTLVGWRVRNLRSIKTLTQAELGKRAGLHYTFVGSVERGERNVSFDTLEKLANGLEVEIAELFEMGIPTMDRNRELRERLVSLISQVAENERDEFVDLVQGMIQWKYRK